MTTRHIRLSLAALLLLMCSLQSQAKHVAVPGGYLFGFVASFQDSIVYFTDIQQLDTIWVSEKKHLLAGRSNYAYQLRDHFSQQLNMPQRTCVVIGGANRKKIEKKFQKMLRQYNSPKGRRRYDVRMLPSSEFTFKPVDMSE